MDKNAIKKYAVWARRELIVRVTQKAGQYGISAKEIVPADAENIFGKVLTATEKKQRQELIAKINREGFTQVMEEAAYTWFNRFCALRFMEVNGYLPTHIRVFTNDEGEFKPQIITEAINLELDGLDMEKVYALKDANDDAALFKYLVIVQCNALSAILPGIFQKINDYTELLFPDNLLRDGSAIEQMVALIPEADWQDQVQIIGWLYQDYNIEQNELVYDGSMSKSRIPKELLSAATTIYTPDWPVRYMVENSLGRIWVEGHPNDELKAGWKYYLDEAEQEPQVQSQLAEIRKGYAALSPEGLRCIDPCCGSGHILVYMFDVLMQIYESCGYSQRDAATLIVQNNLYGLDIDERAAQLAYFAVMMKARQYDRRFFKRGIQPHVYAIAESNNISNGAVQYFCAGRSDLKAALQPVLTAMYDAKEYGSILTVPQVDFELLYKWFDEIVDDISFNKDEVLNELLPVVHCADVLAQKYHVTVTNPPYLGSSRFSPILDKYVKDNNASEKSDLSMVMYKRAISGFVKPEGFAAFITTSSWMFLSSFEKTRAYLFENASIDSLVDFGTELFDGKVGHNPIVSWVTRNAKIDYKMTAIRLVDYCYSRRDEKESEFFRERNRHVAQQDNFTKIPGSPVAYWLSSIWLDLFEKSTKISEIAKPRVGQNTGDNERFLRLWHEVNYNKIGFGVKHLNLASTPYKWITYSKGGAFRRWHGNFWYVVNWEKDGKAIKDYAVIRNKGKHWSRYIQNLDYICCEGVTWSDISSSKFACRYMPEGFICDVKGSSAYPDEVTIWAYLAFLNSVITYEGLKVLAPTISFQTGDISRLPFLVNKDLFPSLSIVAKEQVSISKADWDAYETSWDFKRNPLI